MANHSQASPTEIWKPLVGFEGAYEISDHRGFRSLDRVVPHSRYGTIFKRGQMITPCPNAGGYSVVSLRKDGERKTYLVHRLVLETFVGPCPAGHEGMHLDNNPQNYHLANLKWGTYSENSQQRHDEGRARQPKGEAHGRAKLTVSQVLEIRALYDLGGITQVGLGKRFGVSHAVIRSIGLRKTWKHV